ncbi:hypothetical protein GJ744_005899 [Endocarpon pusillum]|uniref:Uncharacterized protein n=1 Tax=Endocarpon pusillum TaxID=364733 RepID=A0A8H7ANU0_9EURO|nr:hypothetical protein GJ744_005899 [Endocarpon pusillum]
MAVASQQNGSLINPTLQLFGPLAGHFTVSGSYSHTPQRNAEPRKFDWEDENMFQSMSLLISRVAVDIARPEEMDMFNDACRESGKFRRTTEAVARAYYQRGMDVKNRRRTSDMKAAIILKEAMQNARGVCFENFFRTKKHRRTLPTAPGR